MSVIDLPRRFSQCRPVLTHDDIMAALHEALDNGTKGIDVAAVLGIAPARVSEMRKNERRIQQREMQPLAEYLGLLNDADVEPETAEVIEIWEHIPAQWRKKALANLRTFAEPDESSAVK